MIGPTHAGAPQVLQAKISGDVCTSFRGAVLGLVLLASALAFNAFFLAPELQIGRVPPNDAVLHLALSERLVESFSRGEPFLDPWVSEVGLGYPVWRTYQILPHALAGGVLVATEGWTDHASAFAALQYALLVLIPLSAYVGARLFGLTSLAAGLASWLIFTPTSLGNLGWFGLSYGATTWRGCGLFTQLVAVHMLLLGLGATARALDTGRGRPLASALLAATALSHIVFGYVAFVSAALLAVAGPGGERARRCVRLATVVVPALFLLAWFVVPLFLGFGTANHSRWESAHKWDSFGAAYVLSQLLSGSFLDGGRWPILSLLVLVGTLLGLVDIRNVIPRQLLGLSALWLALFFGRPTWGHLLLLAGIPGDLHLHRLQAAFEIPAIFLAAWGVDRLLRLALGWSRVLAVLLAAGVCVALGLLGTDRAHYLEDNTRWGETNLSRYSAEKNDVEHALDAVRVILAERPGRVSAGKAGTWGGQFKVGDSHVYGLVTRAHIDQASFLDHSMSLMSDIMVLRAESDASHDALFGIRAIIAPADLPAPAHWRLRGEFGRFKVYEASPEGYFGLVDVPARYGGPARTFFDENSAWLTSPQQRAGVVVALGAGPSELPAVDGRFPTVTSELQTPRGEILSETKDGETYSASVRMHRPAYALLKITWDPFLAATVDAAPTPVLRVTPGFAAVPVPAGVHKVTVRYAPGPLRPALFIAGLLAFTLSALLLVRPRAARVEARAAEQVAIIGTRLATSRLAYYTAMVLLGLLALRPLFRGQLIDGHDALSYPPRLVEMDRALRDGQLPPLWAPDLGAGYGQPLFEFVPPLLNAAAYPFYTLGAGLADSLQLAVACLCIAGAFAIFGLGRRAGASPSAAVAAAAAWLFAPYLALDLYVRAAFAEASALAVAPVALLGLVRALDRPTVLRIALGAITIALLPLAHNGVVLLVLPAFGLVILAQRSWRAIFVGGLVLLGGLGLSAFFWLPALVEQVFVKTHFLREGVAHWARHIISPFQLLWSPWGYGYSVPGPSDGMSFALGPVHILLGVLGLLVAFRSNHGTRRREAIAYAIAAAAGAWLATSWSVAIWANVETLQYLALPWRALLLPALFLPLLAVPALERLSPRGRFWVVGILIAANLAHTEPKGFHSFSDDRFAPASIAANGINTLTFEEFEPRWVVQRPPYSSDRLVGRNGRMEVIEISLQSARQEFAVRAETDTVAEASTFYYPGWTVRIAGHEVAVEPVPERGTMSFHVPAGIHYVTLELRPTPLRGWATFVAVLTAAILALAVAITCVRLVYRQRALRRMRVAAAETDPARHAPDASRNDALPLAEPVEQTGA